MCSYSCFDLGRLAVGSGLRALICSSTFGVEASHSDSIPGSVLQERRNGFHEKVGRMELSENFI